MRQAAGSVGGRFQIVVHDVMFSVKRMASVVLRQSGHAARPTSAGTGVANGVARDVE
jgi:hypothetical protein